MNNLIINIANYRIRIESIDFDLVPGKRFRNFICASPADPSPAVTQWGGSRSFPKPANIETPTGDTGGQITGSGNGLDLKIRIYRGKYKLPGSSKCVFHAPFIEEVKGMRFEKNPDFWSVWKNDNDLFIKTSFPLSHGDKTGLLKFSLGSPEWDLYINPGSKNSIDPLEYPLDGLVLYYLSVIKGDIMIHASGVNHLGKGFVFSGVSGKGKTTMSGTWKNAGASIIHDDRMILRKTAKGFRMYNTPVYDDEKPSESDIDSLFIIEHGKENMVTKLNGAYAASAVMANCIQHNWGTETISGLLRSVTDLCSEVPVYTLSFKPDVSIVNYLTGQMR